MITFDTHPDQYNHLVATSSTGRSRRWCSMSPRMAASSRGYKLKLNSYYFGVDIELRDAKTTIVVIRRLLRDHPDVQS